MVQNSFNLKVSELCQILKGQFLYKDIDHTVDSVSIDSRTALGQSGEVFFALQGNHLDGHQFIDELFQKGTRNFVVEGNPKLAYKANIIQVDNVLQALQKAAQYKRTLFGGEVIGITGSNGKTIVKEWLSTILETNITLIKSPGSYNSQIGVALSVWPLTNSSDIGIFEAGISKPEEMHSIEQMIRPTVGIFTNIGTAHQENFESVEEKIKEKLKLFHNTELLVIRGDHTELFQIAKQIYPGKLVTWSFQQEAKDQVYVERTANGIRFEIQRSIYTINSPFRDEASLENLTHASITAACLGLTEQQIQKGVHHLQPLKMRLRVIQGINSNYIVDDSYTNDFGGLVKALDFMEKQPLQKSRIVILSDFGSTSTKAQFTLLANLLQGKNIDQMIAIGEEFFKHQEIFHDDALFFRTTDSFLDEYPIHNLKERLILVKGSRRFKFEKIVNRLSQRLHKTSLEIDLDSVVQNLSTYRSKLNRNTKIMVMVKALAYGSGSFEIAKILEFHKVDYLAVAYTDEGKDLREKGINLPILVMNPSLNDGPILAQYNLEPEVFTKEQITSFLQDFRFVGKKLPIHIILNTGMNRLGFDADQLNTLNKILTKEQDIEVKSIFTHLAAADEIEHSAFTVSQANKFVTLSQKIKYANEQKPLKHILNSSGIASYPDFELDMVRLGIGLYGLDPTNSFQHELVYASTFKTTISQVRIVKSGESIGYGRKGIVQRDSKIATIAVGYADGYSRQFGNGKTKVLVNGKLVPTVGNICMDMSMIDVTQINANVGDEVILFGKEPTIKDLATIADTIPYEILTNVSSRVKRIFFAE